MVYEQMLHYVKFKKCQKGIYKGTGLDVATS